MSIYKPSLLDKFKDFVNGLRGNWDIVEAHLAESASKHIAESGSNENGSYIRFDDGTQICYVNMTVYDLALETPRGVLYSGNKTWSFPRAFANIPTTYCGQFRWGTGVSWGNTVGPSKTNVVLVGIDIVSRASGEKVEISAMAIGKWK